MTPFTDYPATILATWFIKSGQEVTREGPELTVGGHRLRLEPEIVNRSQRDGKWLIGVDVRPTLDGTALLAMRSGAFGIEDSEEVAFRTAAEEWALLFGSPLVRALSPLKETDQQDDFRIGNYHVFTGPVGIRCQQGGPENLARFETILGHLSQAATQITSHFSQASGVNPIGIYLMGAVITGQEVTATCHVNGGEIPQLAAQLRGLGWPKPENGSYVLKRFYLAYPVD